MPTSPHRASRRARQAWITRPGRIMSRGRADMGRTLSPLIEEPCARMSQGSRGLFAYDRPRRVGRPRHPGCEASAPLPSRLAPYPSGVGARLRGKPCHGSRQRQHPAVAWGATKSRRPRDVVCSPCFVGAAGARRVATTSLACTITTESPLAPKAAPKHRHAYASTTIMAHRG